MQSKFKIILFIVLSTVFNLTVKSQTVELLTSGTQTSIRGLSVVNDRVIWVSGSNGTVGRSLDSGKTFNWITIKGFEKTDFRDIEAFDETVAVVMGISEPAYILRTGDGGKSWKVVFEDKTKGMFLDAMEFWNDQSGIVIGDPIDGKFFIARTFDGGGQWTGIPPQNYPAADSGEACFASSGTNIRKLNKQEAVFVSGGLTSNLFIRDKKTSIPLVVPGKQTTGANSIAVKNTKILIVVGGDFMAKDDTTKNCFLTTDGGTTWHSPQIPPHGYRSCVEYLGKKKWICTGLNGVDYSLDDGKTWRLISKESYHVCRKAKDGKAVFFAGGNGRIGKLLVP
ncbi:MAG: oxidoreductase [Ferruginibacter sp.]